MYGIPAEPLASGIEGGFGVTVGPHGDVFFAAFNAQTVFRWDPRTGHVDPVVGALGCGPSRVAVDPAGNLFFTEIPCGRIVEYSSAGGLRTLSEDIGCPMPSGIAVGRSGAVYVTTECGQLLRIQDGRVTTLASGLGTLQGLAIDPRGGLLFARYGSPEGAARTSPRQAAAISGAILRWTPTKGVQVLVSGLWRVRDLTVSADGTIYFIEESDYNDQGNSGIVATLVHGRVRTLLYGLDYPEGIAAGPGGTLYFTSERADRNFQGSILFRYQPAAVTHLFRYTFDTGVNPTSRGVVISPVPVQSLQAKPGEITLRFAESAHTDVYVILPRSALDWVPATQGQLASSGQWWLTSVMPGSWWPLPRVTVQAQGTDITPTVYMVRANQGRRWPTRQVGDRYVAPAGFSEAPLAFIAAFPVPANGLQASVRYPAG